VIPKGLGAGTVRYLVESIHVIAPDIRLVVLEQIHFDVKSEPRDARASHTQTYLISDEQDKLRIADAQSAVQVSPDEAGGEGGTR
jgi:hypothetical protein